MGNGFDVTKTYFFGSYSELVRGMERGFKRRKDGTINEKAVAYLGTSLKVSDLTPDMLNALRQNAIDVLHSSILREKWDNVILQTNLMTNPRWRFKEKLPEVVQYLEEAVKGTPAEGKLFQGQAIPHE